MQYSPLAKKVLGEKVNNYKPNKLKKMVMFVCGRCGGCLKKSQVDKHINTQCRGCPYVSCMDCLKEFSDDSYSQHVKCITENQKYGGSNYVQKKFKGEQKQEEWIANIQNIIKTRKDINPNLQNILERIIDYSNVPRKRKKFENFLISSFGIRTPALVKEIWNIFESALMVTTSNEKPAVNKETTVVEAKDSETNNSTEKKDKKKKNKSSDNEEKENVAVSVNTDDANKKKKKKHKKNKQSENNDNTGTDSAVSSTEPAVAHDQEIAKGDQKKKNKKRKHSNNDTNGNCVINGDVSEDTKDEKKNKKRKHSNNDSLNNEINGIDSEVIKHKKKDAKKRLSRDGHDANTTDKENIDNSESLEANAELSPNKKCKKKHKNKEDSIGEAAATLSCESKNSVINGTSDTNEYTTLSNEVKPQGDDGSTFKWKVAIKSALKNSPDNRLKKKKLKQLVLAQYLESSGTEKLSDDEMRAMLDKKLDNPAFVIENAHVQLKI